jgi:hypothetical protein
MGEFLGEPTEALKHELRLLIEENIPQGRNVASFKLNDALVIGISRESISDPAEESYHAVDITEEVPGSNGEKHHSTYYYLFENGKIEKTVEDEERLEVISGQLKTQYTTEEQARIDQESARMQEGEQARVISGMDALTGRMDAFQEYLDKNPDLYAKAMLRTIEAFAIEQEANEAERSLGLKEVSAVELQEVIDKLRTAIANNQDSQQ